MKVKLLKKIRKSCSIDVYEKGQEICKLGIIADKPTYHVKTPSDPSFGEFYFDRKEAIDYVLQYARKRFGKPKENKAVRLFGL